MSREPHAKPDSNIAQQSGLGYLVRFIWMLIGPAIAIISLMLIFSNRQGDLGPADAAFWSAIIVSVLLRFIDVSRLNGLKATGEPASISDWRRYACITTIVALILWSIAHRAAIIAMLGG